MAKTKTPFLSLGAHGSIGGTLTAQKRGSQTLLREKPIPTYPRTLAQVYYQWDYLDYAYLWHQQTEIVKQSYRTRASRYHITGFNLWMREHLRDLPDIAGRWRLDEPSGAIAYDSSRNKNNGIIYGASPATGLIGGCRSFDGIDNRINFGKGASLNNLTERSFECFIYPTELNTNFIINKNVLTFYLWITSLGKLEGVLYYSISPAWLYSLDVPPLNTWTHLLLNYSQKLDRKLHASLNGVEVSYLGQQASVGTITDDSPENLILGGYTGYYALKGLIDQPVYRNRTLDPTETKRHSERRYP